MMLAHPYVLDRKLICLSLTQSSNVQQLVICSLIESLACLELEIYFVRTCACGCVRVTRTVKSKQIRLQFSYYHALIYQENCMFTQWEPIWY